MKISTIIPTYNASRYICQCIDSVLNQTYSQHEIIVVDDGSTDNTYELLQGYSKVIKYIYQENSGPSSARNRGIEVSTGDWLAFVDSDDVWMPDKLEKQVKCISKNRDYVLVVSDMYEGNDPSCTKAPIFEKFDDIKEGFIFDRLLKSSYIYTPTVLVNKDIVKEFNGFDTKLNMLEDLDLFLKIAYKYQIGVVNEMLVFRRRHDQNISKSLGSLDRRAMFWRKVLVDYPSISATQSESVKKHISDSIWASGYDYFDKYIMNEARARFVNSIIRQYRILGSIKYIIMTFIPITLLKYLRGYFYKSGLKPE